MEEELAARNCVPCTGTTPPVPDSERPALLAELNGWALEGGVLTKTIALPDFVSAVELVNEVTPIAEAEGHHPDLLVSYGKLRIDLTTHAINDLSDNDFILAAKIDRLLAER